MSEDDVVVTDNRSESRFEAHLGGELAGFAAYERGEDLITFTHTEVDEAFEGHGVASELARAALDAVREEGSREVDPQCAFIAGWISKHPDYEDLVRSR